jgi:uncharacterized protein YndB with AHSA1/START domain
MARHRFSVHVRASPAQVFALWTDLDRAREWIEGLTKVDDITGPVDRVGTRYVSWFGPMRSSTEVIEADRPRVFATRFGISGRTLLRGESRATFEPEGDGTRLTQEFVTEGLVAAIFGRIFAMGSYRGSFRGELDTFVRLAEAEARARTDPDRRL